MNPPAKRFRSAAAQARFEALYDSILQLWPVPYEEVDVPSRFGSTHIIIAGPQSAPPLVLLHGFKATSTMWANVIGELAQHYRCYAIDTIDDAGKSVASLPVHSPADYAEWLGLVLDGLELRQARFAGISYGGFIAASMALHAPGRVTKLALLCPAGTLAPLTPAFFIRAIPALIWKNEAIIRGYWRWFFHDKRNAAHPAASLFVASWQSFNQPREFVIPGVFTDEELRRITVPTTVLIGDHEVIYKPGPAAALERARLLPDVRAFLVPGAGHVQTLDNPEAVLQHVLDGLA